MQEEKFISEFWKSNERSNFSKEATVPVSYTHLTLPTKA